MSRTVEAGVPKVALGRDDEKYSTGGGSISLCTIVPPTSSYVGSTPSLKSSGGAAIIGALQKWSAGISVEKMRMNASFAGMRSFARTAHVNAALAFPRPCPCERTHDSSSRTSEMRPRRCEPVDFNHRLSRSRRGCGVVATCCAGKTGIHLEGCRRLPRLDQWLRGCGLVHQDRCQN